ncbi:DUF1294 domain-containing protein [Bacillus sp. CGMCC 1.16541]|uniref:DUF1294 domain-containing protein n=1 Tax=Bacillus sp. CGMCC 1.16541 TaxID=2185143 RepID=UPI000D72D8B7|nr:DUF1294 domain-containing protein [Bacillus sp. CGMCC 1.16541]
MQSIMFIYLALINVVGFYVMGVDKKRAKKKQWRVKENTLWTIALVGGAIGLTVGMYVFRHKTKHTIFKLGLPFLSLVLIALFIMNVS